MSCTPLASPTLAASLAVLKFTVVGMPLGVIKIWKELTAVADPVIVMDDVTLTARLATSTPLSLISMIF